jgi:N-acetyl-1-D-myo-inositol-2-amino-2-deoxy-alpha-D-glucopyranoside deacetylase
LTRSLQILGAGSPRLLGYGDRAFADSSGDKPAFCDAPFDELVEAVVTHIRAFRPDTVLTYDPLGVYGHPDHIQTHRVAVAAIGAAAYPQLYPEAGPPWRTKLLYQATMPFSAARLLWPAVMKQANQPVGLLPGVPDDQVDVLVDVSGWADTKWNALCAHRSEMARGGAMTMLAALPEQTRCEVLRTEWFMRMPLETKAESYDALNFAMPQRSVDLGT